jgi:hypothetical protein
MVNIFRSTMLLIYVKRTPTLKVRFSVKIRRVCMCARACARVHLCGGGFIIIRDISVFSSPSCGCRILLCKEWNTCVLVLLPSVITELAAAISVEETVLLQHGDGMKPVGCCKQCWGDSSIAARLRHEASLLQAVLRRQFYSSTVTAWSQFAASGVEETVLLQHGDGMKPVCCKQCWGDSSIAARWRREASLLQAVLRRQFYCSTVTAWSQLAAASSVEETVLLQHGDGKKPVSYCAIRIHTAWVFGIICSRDLSDMCQSITRLRLVFSVT